MSIGLQYHDDVRDSEVTVKEHALGERRSATKFTKSKYRGNSENRFFIPSPDSLSGGTEERGFVKNSPRTQRQRYDKPKALPPQPPTGLSLREELFPEEAKLKADIAKQTRQKRKKLGRLSLDIVNPDANSDGFLATKQQLADRKPQPSTSKPTPTVLLLSNASPCLEQSDFLRIIPRGQHIEEWRGAADFLQVIPGRTISTLAPNGLYYLLFPSHDLASAYMSHVTYLHNLSRKYCPTSLDSPLPPFPGQKIDGIDNIYGLLQDYTLTSSRQNLSIEILRPPYRYPLAGLIGDKGYRSLLSNFEDDSLGRSVLFWVKGYAPSQAEIQAWIAKDGRRRGLYWGGEEQQMGGVGLRVQRVEITAVVREKAVEAAAAAKSSRTKRRNGSIVESLLDGEESGDDGSWMTESETMGEEDNLELARSIKRKWVITFQDEAEARTFVRMWHGEAWDIAYRDLLPPTIHAEFLW
ncbi:hypothetical protein MMC25_000409 [Agyrium rufum]|nr:hypothetical protein [Agyrium rufum]